MAGAVREDRILDAIQRGRHSNDLFFTHVKDGASYGRTADGGLLVLDAVAFRKSWAKPLVTGYEVKCTRSDWLRDDKWVNYRQLCHQFYLAAPKGVVESAELPEGVGLIHYYPQSGSIRMAVKARLQEAQLDPMLMFYVLMTRTEPDRHPMFSSEREFLRAWVEDKQDRKMLGQLVRSKAARETVRLERRVEELERDLRYLREDRRHLDEIRKILRGVGIDTRDWQWEQKLTGLLQGGLPPQFVDTVRLARQLADELESMLPRQREAAE